MSVPGRVVPALILTLGIVSVLGGRSATATAAPDPYVQRWGHYPHTSFRGAPDLRLTLALVDAGGGPTRFDAARLVTRLAGSHANAETAKLTKQSGADNVRSFLAVFTYAVDDTLRFVRAERIALPASPAPDPADGKALSAALYRSGVMPNGEFDVGYMLEHLISRPGHVQVMKDINRNPALGPKRNAEFHIVLTQAVRDLKAAYKL